MGRRARQTSDKKEWTKVYAMTKGNDKKINLGTRKHGKTDRLLGNF